mgnify:CR=1 FL=1
MNQELLMNPNCLVAALEKPAAELLRQILFLLFRRIISVWSISCILLLTGD